MSTARPLFRLLTVLALCGMVLSPVATSGASLPVVAPRAVMNTTPSTGDGTQLYRTQITVDSEARWQRLQALSFEILTRTDTSARLLVDATQLETLARLGFTPMATEALDLLADTARTEQPWLAWRLQPLLEGAESVQAANAEQAAQRLHSAMQALTIETRTALATTSSIDDDGDGLTNTQENWWCTDVLNPDSDGDGTKDGAEVDAAKAWLANAASRPPATGKPFSGWPVNKSNCPDDDQDSVPDLAERWELGLNLNRESTDRDKFDDGQELFGNTYCPGSGGFCGYGALPRNEDWGVIFAEMPSWVKAPGNHPLVAAFPKPEVDVVESSFRLQTVTTITTDHTINQGTERTYSTAKTEGTSTSVANTTTWNEWQEVAESLQQRLPSIQASSTFEFDSTLKTDGFWGRAGSFGLGTLKIVGGAGGAIAGCAVGAVTIPTIALTVPGAALCGAGIAGGIAGIIDGGQDVYTAFAPDQAQQIVQPNLYQSTNIRLENQVDLNNQTNVVLNQSFNTDDIVDALNANRYAELQSGQLISQRIYEIGNILAAPTSTTTNTQGRSWGGAQTTTTEQYEEHTVTNGEAFSSGESWGNATAQDSAHAADLWFTYKVRNTGTEYAREIADLAFNVYIGDDPKPAYTYFVAPDVGGDGKFRNFMPNEEHPYTSQRIPLTLEQMRAIDLGGPIRIVVEDFTYGIDELFYQDAANAGVLIAMEDGTDDGDESIDPYLLPTWDTESALDVLARYFPHETDADGTIISIWTPEYRSDTPSWCQESFRPSGPSSLALWCKHALSTADWWNIYTNGLGDGSQSFQDTPAAPGAVALFRFNQDSDLDGFSDRSEARLGTAGNDPASFPHPEVLAGVHRVRTGNDVVATLSLLNTGLYDAYGVEAIMVAPDDSVTITNNTVGGSGRVRALNQVIVGSRIALQSPLPAAWSQANHATPAAGGYFTGSADRTYTFAVNCSNPGGCTVGSGAWTVAWNDGAGSSGTLNFDTGYASPTFLPVGSFGVTLALYSGSVSNGDSFTVTARTPRDTFQYTINREPYTEPLVIVSYNDPQGNHRFIVPSAAMQLTTPNDDLNPFAGTMLQDVGVEIVTTAAFNPGANTANLLVNNPSATQLTDTHLFLEFIDPSGTVVHEATSSATLAPGPSYVTVNWDSSSFSPAYQSQQDYIVLAFLTDYQGNILDTGGRPLSSFQTDPLPTLVTDDSSLTWNFGSVAQGALLRHRLSMANTGFGPLYTFVDASGTLALSQAGQRTVGAAGVADYQLTLRTANLPVGPYDETFMIKTSDPANPTRTFHVVGTITAPEDTPAGPIQRPLDVPVTVTGPKNQGDLIEFTHTLGPDAATLHPVKIFNNDYSVLKGVGEYATDFAAGTAPADMFGDGRDGVMPSSGNLDNNNGSAFGVVNNGNAGATSITVTDAYGVARINPGDVVLIHQTQGTGAGCWEINKAVSDFAGNPTINTYQLANPLKCNYASSGNNHAQIVRVPQYATCNVTGTVTPITAWNGSWGGILAVMCNTTMNVSGSISSSGRGYRGGLGDVDDWAWTGEGDQSPSIRRNIQNPPGNGGGANHISCAGGGNGTLGISGGEGTVGDAAGTPDLSTMVMGGGGGGAGGGTVYGAGGNGGGIVLIAAESLSVTGSILSDGGNGQDVPASGRSGCGGAGGSIFIKSRDVNINSGTVRANVGAKGTGGAYSASGDGGLGRIRVEYCDSLGGATYPNASTQKLNCYIAEQGAIASNLFGTGADGDITISTDTTFNSPHPNFGMTATAGQQLVNLASVTGLTAGDELLLIQIQGTGAGNYEFGRIISINGNVITLRNPLQHTYTQDALSKAQAVRVSNYQNVTVTPTGRWHAPTWDGVSGGIIVFRSAGLLTIQSGGIVDLNGKGFRGGSSGGPCTDGQPGEGINGPGSGMNCNTPGGSALSANAQGGGGGDGRASGGSGGGGGGHVSNGNNGATNTREPELGVGGIASGDPSLANIRFGGGGGQGGSGHDSMPGRPQTEAAWWTGGSGGAGGGIALLFSNEVSILGTVQSNGNAGTGGQNSSGGGGGGAGGSLLIVGRTLSVNSGTVRSLGASGGGGSSGGADFGGAGGSSSNGRIRIEFCDSFAGTTNPAASTQQIDCYIAQQGETGTSRFLLPENVPSTATYNVQFGRKLDFATAGEQVTLLRVPARMSSDTYLDMLISNVGSGDLTARIDIGNDGVWDWEQTTSANGAVALTSPNLAAAFNSYWSTHGVPTAGGLDVPMKVSLSKAGQVLLTNLQTSAATSYLRTVQISAASYQSMVFNLTAGSSGASVLSVAIDVGDNGTIEWSSVANRSFPAQLSTANLATAINAYLTGNSGTVNVPVRIYVSPQLVVTINDYNAVVAGAIDLVAQSVSAPSPSDEGATLALQTTLRNSGSAASGPLTAAFFATLPDWGDWYIGSAFLTDLAPGANGSLGINWATTGFRGNVPVKVVLTPYNTGLETNLNNNLTTATFTLRARPDLQVTAINLSDDEPLAGEAINVALDLHNQGVQQAGSQTTSLYIGNPADNGQVISEQTQGFIAGGANVSISYPWTPATPGLYRLFGRADRDNAVNEYDEGNNDSWRDLYVGLATPVLLDSGAASDTAYTTQAGYGYVDEGQPDVVANCGAEAHQTFRRDPDGRVIYRFDHLQPGHFYHLNVTMFECVAAGRRQTVYVDGNLVAGPEDLGDGQIHRLSIRLDPALYADRSVTLSVEDPSIDGALVGEVNLVDVNYRYADAGGPSDSTYSAARGYGWLDGTASTAWGALPYQSVRVDQADSELRYRFDNLTPGTSYKLNFTFWQPSGQERIQKVYVNGIDLGIEVDTGDYQVHRVSAPVPIDAYSGGDHSIIVAIKRLNGSSGAMVNEIALEAETLPGAGRCTVQPTPYRMDVYGSVMLDGQPAAAGSLVEAVDPRGNVIGCFVVTQGGQYGFMPIYGEDTSRTPAIPGMQKDEMMLFKVNGIPALAAPKATWQQGASQQVELNAGGIQDQSIALRAGWNLISTHIEPLLPPLRQALGSIDGRYDRVLSATGLYATTLDNAFNTLHEIQSGTGYYLRTIDTGTTYLLVQGVPQAADTPIALQAGWNWIGYLPQSTIATATALQSINGLYQRVLSLDKAYVPSLPGFSTLQSLEAGQGYLIFMNQEATLTYPAGSTAAVQTETAPLVVAASCDDLAPTPFATLIYGYVTLNGNPAPVGTVVEVLTPQKEMAGCFVVQTAGQYGLMHVYGRDDSASPPIPGFVAGEELAFRVNGFNVSSSTPLQWLDDKALHQVDLVVDGIPLHQLYLPVIAR